jgi:hypothetical protein
MTGSINLHFQVDLSKGDSVFSVSYNWICIQIIFSPVNFNIIMRIELKYFATFTL